MNIYEKMLAITEELTAVAKNLTVGVGSNAYKAVGEADVLSAVKPLEVKHKVYSYPYSRKVIDTNIMTSTSTYNGSARETQKLFMRIETIYRFVNIEDPSDYVDITTYGDGVDTQDKACGKAMTYADKYALLKAYKIITGEDPDQSPSEENKIKPKAASKSPYRCCDCGEECKSFTDNEGRIWTAKQVFEAAKKTSHDGKPRCTKCRQALEQKQNQEEVNDGE